ncbi:polysaccharide deacetylase family protein [Ichthyenterobacterium magnum]|uniref:Peptidoglycan/xylan/chitin deacetylase (PgdA/CDA1 family) n=1 Tax=Ichthyenterobacterium magnum TaxID=1230530 RepID=A0A420DXV2_9FLAO|nr:polysaccharide deacetylase family protein [Ichthyenterobacterium magnum]RKE99068.1 peptidoglycan/xylan/chitin deacetylase (PgdA/CDA1 family) [Ichthyenterobacterium magnum]
MKIVPIKTPLVAKKMFPNYVWNISTSENVIYLTFDDGPTPEITSWTLDILQQYNAKATFFCIGGNIEKHPDIFQQILDKGHTIGNHTQNHIKGWTSKTKTYLNDVLSAQEVINKLLINDHLLFRPPYGQIKPKQGKKLIGLNYKIVMWDVLSFDWDKTVSKEECLNNVISTAKQGSIIVFHDSIKASKNMQFALPKVLEYFNNKGYTFKSL